MSILDDAIEYLKELERRVEGLESCRDSADLDPKTRRKLHDAREGTSDNYGNKKTGCNGKKPLLNKRKARDMDEAEPETNHVVPKDSPADNVAVRLKNKDVVIEIQCPWRDGVLLEIMDVLSNLRLDSHSVQSSTVDGIISLTIKSMVRGQNLDMSRKFQALVHEVKSTLLTNELFALLADQGIAGYVSGDHQASASASYSELLKLVV